MKKQADIAEDQYELLRELKNNVIHKNREGYSYREQDKSGEHNIPESFHAISVDVRNNDKTILI